MEKPAATGGMRHVALYVSDLEASVRFYTQILDMVIEWQPDPDNIYLCSGCDNLALHRAPATFDPQEGQQRLDHIGFILKTPEDVDRWFDYMNSFDVKMKTQPRTHRDGARSFYCFDPGGNLVQMIYHPPISDKCG